MNINNCPDCGKIFVSNPRGMCNDCFGTANEDSKKCNAELQKSGMKIAELSSLTGLSRNRILSLLKLGYVRPIRGFGLEIECRSCGRSAFNSVLCRDCEKGFGVRK